MTAMADLGSKRPVRFRLPHAGRTLVTQRDAPAALSLMSPASCFRRLLSVGRRSQLRKCLVCLYLNKQGLHWRSRTS
ncbi:hypothetical protein PoMZ_11765 [Pyricularia oryzae]|uniref:Uncharacterized protein n=1 Tax=Pyricularia oryzae TaxID=318829 RepID=A0A4V1C7C2_PYROR|nr:hypothetical protein PoMZ_11765 [Pyricularia oryzae]